MNIVKINLILINLFFLFFFNNILKAESNFYIVTKVDNEIITNVDIVHEANYMIALNNDLKKIDKKSLVNLARESLVREKIKKIEVLKNESSLTVNDAILEGIIQSYYNKLKLESLSEFKDYLASYNLRLQDIKEKLIKNHW